MKKMIKVLLALLGVGALVFGIFELLNGCSYDCCCFDDFDDDEDCCCKEEEHDSCCVK
ncbi:MAG: hypothetical protein Q4A72_02065 [Bacillota bacterium]|nr:hypothetical protein [Bacillota bacterium]